MYILCPKTKQPAYESNLFVFIASVVIVPSMFNHTRSSYLLLFQSSNIFVLVFIVDNDRYALKLHLSRQQPSLPANQGMRPIQSPRPYTTYELDQIRQYQKRSLIDHKSEKKKNREKKSIDRLIQYISNCFLLFLRLVSSTAMSLVAAWQMSMQLFDNVAVHIR
jgi:hypothetical protein